MQNQTHRELKPRISSHDIHAYDVPHASAQELSDVHGRAEDLGRKTYVSAVSGLFLFVSLLTMQMSFSAGSKDHPTAQGQQSKALQFPLAHTH